MIHKDEINNPSNSWIKGNMTIELLTVVMVNDVVDESSGVNGDEALV